MTPSEANRPIFFLATPLHDGRVHHAYMAGVLEVVGAFPEQLIISKFTGLNLPYSRDVLTARFVRSKATHLLWVDSDIGWTGADLEQLLRANEDFVCGNYARKQAQRELASPARPDGQRKGDLVEAHYAAAGFLLLTRHCVERMIAAHPELYYDSPKGPAWALWSPMFDGLPLGEDVSFSQRWRKLGGTVWLHSRVIVKHFGDRSFTPPDADE